METDETRKKPAIVSKSVNTSPIKTVSESTETEPYTKSSTYKFLTECQNDIAKLTKILEAAHVRQQNNEAKEKQQFIQISQHQLDKTKPILGLVVSDSMTRKIRNRHLKRKLNWRYETATLKKFPGQTAREIELYTQAQIKLHQPDYVIVVAGTNDLSYSYQNGTFDRKELANKILNVARMAKKYGKPASVSSLFVREDRYVNECVWSTNELLRELCLKEGFGYIDQDEIKLEHISKWDGLHLDQQGSDILKTNILLSIKAHIQHIHFLEQQEQ